MSHLLLLKSWLAEFQDFCENSLVDIYTSTKFSHFQIFISEQKKSLVNRFSKRDQNYVDIFSIFFFCYNLGKRSYGLLLATYLMQSLNVSLRDG